MKTSTYFFATIVAGGSLLLSVQKNSTISKNLTFSEALSQGLLICKSSGAGGYSGKSVSLNLTNKSASSLTILIQPGTLFYPSDPGQQTLITMENQLISLAPSEKKKETIYAYCSEAHDRSPTVETTFSIGRNNNPKFDSLFTFMKPLKIPSNYLQSISWAISDNSPVSAIGSETIELKKLRKYLYKVTGQEEENFTSDFIESVDERGYIVRTLYRVKGFIEFNSDKTKWLHQEVYDENGKLKFKSMQAFEIPRGKSDYSFNLVVKGWKEGNYTMKLKCGSEVVEKYPFKV